MNDDDDHNDDHGDDHDHDHDDDDDDIMSLWLVFCLSLHLM